MEVVAGGISAASGHWLDRLTGRDPIWFRCVNRFIFRTSGFAKSVSRSYAASE